MREFTENYFGRLNDLYGQINADSVEELFVELNTARKNDNNIFFIGNGGSASTASRFTVDLLNSSIKKGLLLPFKAVSLCESVPMITSIGVDCDFEDIFVEQLKIYFKERDLLVAISASGNSANTLKAVDWVNENNGISFGLVGFDGGKLKKKCQKSIFCKSKKGEYGPVEDMHLIIDHMIQSYIMNYIS